MCLKPGSEIKVDGRTVTVIACVNNRMVGERSDGIPVVRDIKIEPPTGYLADKENISGNTAIMPPGSPALTSHS